MAQGQPLWPCVPQQSQGQEVPRAPSPGARSAALGDGTCSCLGAGVFSCPLLQNILALRRSVSHWHGWEQLPSCSFNWSLEKKKNNAPSSLSEPGWNENKQ